MSGIKAGVDEHRRCRTSYGLPFTCVERHHGVRIVDRTVPQSLEAGSSFAENSTVYTWLCHIALIHDPYVRTKPANSVLVPVFLFTIVYHRGPAAAPASLCRRHFLSCPDASVAVGARPGYYPPGSNGPLFCASARKWEANGTACATNISETAVKVHLFRAVQFLRKKVNKPRIERI